MTVCNLIKKLQERGLISQITNEKTLEKKINQGPITLYCGFDPTSDSLHLGHLIPLLCLRYFQQEGHKTIILVGGATGLIGDPSFKSKERKLNKKKTVKNYVKKISKQITTFLNFNSEKKSYIIVNNYDWYRNMTVLTFLRNIGKYFSINHLINRESVKKRLNRDNTNGISFTEFSYSLFQGYDFACLNNLYNAILQIGGTDQWGNIISGIDLTQRLYKNKVFGLTFPLLTRSDGKKFGKTESQTIWLDPKKTSPYKFYQFWINTSDSDVYQFLKFFTPIELDKIKTLELKNKRDNRELSAQYVLADSVTQLVHGKDGLNAAKRITENLFNETLDHLSEEDFQQLAQDGILMIKMKKGDDLIHALIYSKFQPSRSQARKTISSHAVSINGRKQIDFKYVFSDTDRLFGKYTLLRHGKKNFCLIYWEKQ